MKKLKLILVASIFFTQTQIAMAIDKSGLSVEQTLLANEFVFKTSPTQKIMPVRLISGTSKPGIYHLPEGTRLTSLVALSGGKQSDDDFSEIIIKRNDTSFEFDLDSYIEDNKGEDPILQAGDIVSVKKDKPWISDNTYLLATFVATLASIALTVELIDDRN